MERLGLFFLLVVFAPGVVFWAGQGFSAPPDAVEVFLNQTNQLRGFALDPPAPAEAREPDPQPEDGKEPEKGEAETPEPKGEPDKPDPFEQAKELYDKGDFAAAARGFDRIDDRGAAISRFAEALTIANPKDLPDGRYLVIYTKDGNSFEGFAEEKLTMVKLTSATGLKLSIPKDRIDASRTLSFPASEKIGEKVAEVRAEGMSENVKGPRVFHLIQQALKLGYPDAASALILRAVELDQGDERGFLATAIRARVDPVFRDRVLRAYTAIPQVTSEPETPVVEVKTPRKLGGSRTIRKGKPLVEDPKAQEFLRQARVLVGEGDEMFDDIVRLRIKDQEPEMSDIEAAAGKYDAAIDLYSKSQEIEDSNGVFALIQYASKRFAKLQAMKLAMGG